MKQICRERGAALVATGRTVEPHEDLEGKVLGFGHGAERAVEKREERFLPFVEELLPRALVTGGTAGEAEGVFVGDCGRRRGVGRGRRAEDAEQPLARPQPNFSTLLAGVVGADDGNRTRVLSLGS